MQRFIEKLIHREILGLTSKDTINEEKNPAYDRTSRYTGDSLKRLWDVIEKKQEELQKEVFGVLGDEIMDITKEKADSMGYEFMNIPHTICRAGNDKLPPNVLIINMSSSLMCPSFYLGICTIKNGACYAQNGENLHTNSVLQNRWETDLMHTQLLQKYKQGDKKPMRDYFNLVETYIQLGNAYSASIARRQIERVESRTGKKLTKEQKDTIRLVCDEYRISDVRLNETGDFHCQLAVDLWAKFAKKIKRKYGIDTHAYTARNLDFSKAAKVMAVNTSHKGIDVGDEPEREFRAVDTRFYNSLKGGDEVEMRQPKLGLLGDTYFYKCPCTRKSSKCDRCGVCFDRNKTGKPYVIYVRYHGIVAADGLKGLFTKGEVENVIERLYKHGWVTEEEYKRWSSGQNQERLDKLSKKIVGKRKDGKKKKK